MFRVPYLGLDEMFVPPREPPVPLGWFVELQQLQPRQVIELKDRGVWPVRGPCYPLDKSFRADIQQDNVPSHASSVSAIATRSFAAVNCLSYSAILGLKISVPFS